MLCTVLCTVKFKRTGPQGPVFSWIADFAWSVPVLDGLLPGVVIDGVLWRYLACPAAGDAVEWLLINAGHVLRGRQDGSRQK